MSPGLTQVLSEVGKWPGCISEFRSWENPCRDCRVPPISAPCLHDRCQDGVLFIVQPPFSVVLFSKGVTEQQREGLLLLFPGCGSLGQVDRGWERRLQCLHADWKTPEKAHGLLVAKEQIYSQASEVKERIHSQRPRGRLCEGCCNPMKAARIAGLQSIWKERLVLKGNRKRGRFVFKTFIQSASSRGSAFA